MNHIVHPPRSVVLAAACAYILACWTSVSLAQAEPQKHHFPGDALRQWSVYREFSYQLQGKIATSTESIMDDCQKVSKKYEVEIKQNNNCSLLLSRYFDGRPVSEVAIINNPQYSFQIKKSRNNRDWLLANLQLSGDGSSFGDRPIRESTSALACLPFYVYERPLSSIVRDRNFQIIKMVESSRRGLAVVRIDFVTVHPIFGLKSAKSTSIFID